MGHAIKIKPAVLLIGYCLAITACYAGSSRYPALSDTAAVAVINHYRVSEKEMLWQMDRQRAACHSYFNRRYGNYLGGDFWVHDFHGETPWKWSREKALSTLTEDENKRQVMACFGILQGFSFSGFQALYQKENEQRQQKRRGGELVYGNAVFSEEAFYTYLMSRAVLATEKAMLQKSTPSDSLLLALYEQIKEREFKVPPTIKILLAPKDVAGQNPPIVMQFYPEHSKSDELRWPEIYARSRTFKEPGNWSAPFKDENGKYCRIKCLEIKDNGYISFPEVKDNLRQKYAVKLLESSLAQIRKSNKIVTVPNTWDNLKQYYLPIASKKAL